MRYLEVKRMFCFYLFLHKPNRAGRYTIHLFGIAGNIMFGPFFIFVLNKITGFIACISIAFIIAQLLRRYFCTQIPLAKMRGSLLTVKCFKHTGNGLAPNARNIITGWKGFIALANGGLSKLYASSAWRANGVGRIASCKPHALGYQPVNIGCFIIITF